MKSGLGLWVVCIYFSFAASVVEISIASSSAVVSYVPRAKEISQSSSISIVYGHTWPFAVLVGVASLKYSLPFAAYLALHKAPLVDGAVVACKFEVDNYMKFVVRNNWRHMNAIAYEQSLHDRFLDSRAASSCLSDEEYVKRVAVKFFKQNRRLTPDADFNRWTDTLDEWSRGELEASSWQGEDEMIDTQQLLSWFITFIDTVVNNACPYLVDNWKMPNKCYFPELNVLERTECFLDMAKSEAGVECRNALYFLDEGDHIAMFQIQECAEDVHRDVHAWSIESTQKTTHLTEIFILTLLDLEDAYRIKIGYVEKQEPPTEKSKFTTLWQLGTRLGLLDMLALLVLCIMCCTSCRAIIVLQVFL